MLKKTYCFYIAKLKNYSNKRYIKIYYVETKSKYAEMTILRIRSISEINTIYQLKTMKHQFTYKKKKKHFLSFNFLHVFDPLSSCCFLWLNKPSVSWP